MTLEILFNFMESPQAVRWQIMSYYCIISGFKRNQAYYEQNYGRYLTSEPKKNNSDIQTKSALGLEKRFLWRKFPSEWLLFALLRVLSAIYLSYIIIKYLFSQQIDYVLRLFVELKRPIHCYLMGRYILSESVAELMGVFFAIVILLWRYTQLVSGPYRYSLFFFLIQTEHDRELIYARLFAGFELGHNQLGQSNGATDCSPLGALERFHLDTMCYRVIYPHKVIVRLRTNRTRDAHYKLRRSIARATCIVFAFVIPISVTLFVTHMTIHMSDQRYLRVYPNCDPELERLNKLGQIGTWSMTFTSHHLAAMFIDELENLIVWIECGLIATIAPAMAYQYNYDLVLQWSGIRRKIEHMLLLAKTGFQHPSLGGLHLSLVRNDETYELAAEVSDFFKQVANAGQALAQFINVTLIGFLSLSALYTYLLQTNYVHQASASLVAVLFFMAMALSAGCYSLLLVHHHCSSSYTVLCSLLAHLKSKPSKGNFASLIEFFAKHRDCYLLMGLYPFLPTTFLTIIGWSFSCICIIAGVLSEKAIQNQLRTFEGVNTSFVS